MCAPVLKDSKMAASPESFPPLRRQITVSSPRLKPRSNSGMSVRGLGRLRNNVAASRKLISLDFEKGWKKIHREEIRQDFFSVSLANLVVFAPNVECL